MASLQSPVVSSAQRDICSKGVPHCSCLPSRRGKIGALKQQHVQQTCRTVVSRRCSRQVRAAAAEEENSSAVVTDVKKIGVIPFVKDEETFQDVMAFAGPAPERINGRIAMIAFAGAAAAEFATGKSIFEQAANSPFFITFMVFLISLGSLLPKYASGVPLVTLLDATGRESLPSQLAFFNKTHELWLGRIAMLGFTGLVAVEIFQGGAFF